MAFDLVARLKLEDRMSSKLRGATSAVKNMDRAMSSASSRVGGFGSLMSPLSLGLKVATAGFAAMGLAATAAGYAVFKISANALKLSSDAEQASIAFTTMLGSADKSKAFLDELTTFANSTPFELPGLRDSAKRMLAFGFTSKQVIPILTGLGNAAAGLGLGADGLDRLTIALGQIKAKGRLQGDEALQLTEAGVPVWDILAKKMRVTTAEVIKLSSKGLIPADAAINALIEGMKEKFPNMMEKQSKSLAGLWSTIKDTFNNRILIKWGDGIRLAIQPKLAQLTTWLDNNGATIQRWGNELQSVASSAATALSNSLSTAFTYIRTHYLDNPEFQKLSFTGKVGYVFDDIKTAFDTWWTNTGKSAFETKSQEITTALMSVLENSVPEMTEIGVKLGTGIASGMWSGMQESKSLSWLFKTREFLTPKIVDKAWEAILGTGGGKDDNNNGKQTPTKKSSGLDFVPRDNMPVLVHRGERIQTKTEADAQRSGRGKGGVIVTGNTFHVRQESDINAIAMELARLIETNEGAASVG